MRLLKNPFNRFLFIPQISFLLFATSLYGRYPFLIYYGQEYPLSHFIQYETVVLDPDAYPDVRSLHSHTYAYLSLGEVNSARWYFQTLKKNGYLEGQNREWGSFHIHIADGKWENFLLDEIIPSIIQGGYNGIFLDTVDSLVARNIPKKQIVKLISAIKTRYPHLKLMLNRGFEIADIVPIDAILYESTISSYDFGTKKFSFFRYDFRYSPKKPIERFSVDYWYQNEPKQIGEIYKTALKKGYKPLVTDISLTRLPVVRWNSRTETLESDR